MVPWVRRSWALHGHPSTLLEARGKREKIFLAGALWWQSGHPELHWLSQTLLNTYYDSECMATFVEGLLTEVAGKWVLVWDDGPIHRGGPIRKLLAGQAPGLSLEPPYAPHLNPVAFAWSWIKLGRLCNFVPRNIHQVYPKMGMRCSLRPKRERVGEDRSAKSVTLITLDSAQGNVLFGRRRSQNVSG